MVCKFRHPSADIVPQKSRKAEKRKATMEERIGMLDRAGIPYDPKWNIGTDPEFCDPFRVDSSEVFRAPWVRFATHGYQLGPHRGQWSVAALRDPRLPSWAAPWSAQGTDREAVTAGSRRWRSQTAGNAIQRDDSTPEGNAVADFPISLSLRESRPLGAGEGACAALPGRYRVRPSQKEGEDVEFPV